MAEIFLDAGGDGPVWRAGLLDGLVLLVHVVAGVGIVVTFRRVCIRSAVLPRESGRCDHGCDHGCCGGVGLHLRRVWGWVLEFGCYHSCRLSWLACLVFVVLAFSSCSVVPMLAFWRRERRRIGSRGGRYCCPWFVGGCGAGGVMDGK